MAFKDTGEDGKFMEKADHSKIIAFTQIRQPLPSNHIALGKRNSKLWQLANQKFLSIQDDYQGLDSGDGINVIRSSGNINQ